MTTQTDTTTGQAPQATEPERRGDPTNLSFRYGTIGIQAVAAAARYSAVRKQPATTPVAPRIDQRFVESAV